MLMTYGRGRAEQFRLHPTPGSALNFVPPLFLVYLVALPFLLALLPFGRFFLVPMGFYGLAVLAQAAVLAVRKNMLRAIAAVPLIVMSHILYGWGFWRGLFTKLHVSGQRPAVEVLLETVPR